MRRKLTHIALIALGGLLFTAVLGWLYLRSSLPETAGERRLAGIEAPVTIARDANGVPHITAETMTDASFALGFAHAQDRLWQMEMNRRLAAGRLSEFAGEATVEADIYLRTLSIYERAQRSWQHQTPQTQRHLRAYADGVNAYLASRPGALPPEFLLTGVDPEPWTPIDTLGWFKMMALDLGGNMGGELARLDLASVLDREQLQEFFPPYPGEEAIPLPDFEELYDGMPIEGVSEAAQTALDAAPTPSSLPASNNWALSGEHTETGAPIVANDPHLGLNVPSIWYLAHIRVGEREAAGATLPGAPFIVLGHNSHLAWSFTNLGPDVQDLYLEKLVEGGAAYLTPEGSEGFTTREETIGVDGAEPVTITVRETRHGPVISDANEEAGDRLPENAVLALRWTALDVDDTTTGMGPVLLGAESADEVVEALHVYNAPVQNIVFATKDGDIGYYAPGRIPIRGPENDTHGLVPTPGWKNGYDWQGYIPFDELPQKRNPESGMIVTANAKTVNDSYPHFITAGWSLPYRRQRIRELLEGEARHNLESTARIQMDVRSGPAGDLFPLMLKHVRYEHGGVLEAMEAWDLEMREDAPEPLIYAAWHRHLAKQVYSDELGEKFERYWRRKITFLKNVLSDTGNAARWCDDGTTETREDCSDAVTAALDDALAELESRFGSDWRAWRWGEPHQAIQSHRPFSQVPILKDFFELRSPGAGGSYTVNVATPSFSEPDLYSFGHAPSFRAIYDLADLARSRYILPAGQSGNPFAAHYDDQLALWRAGQTILIPLKGREADWEVLKLEPSREN